MSIHRTLAGVQIHVAYAFTYANATARNAATLASTDLGKFARQTDTNTIWMLIDESPTTWVQIGGMAGAVDAADVSYATTTDLVAGDVLAAVEEVYAKVPTDAANLPFTTTSDLVATDTNAAIEEVYAAIPAAVDLVPHTEQHETVTLAANAITINCNNGNVFGVSLNQSINTITVSNIPASGTAYSFTLYLTISGAYTVNFTFNSTAVTWAGGVAPTLSAATSMDFFVFTTWNGGTNWYGFVAGQDY